MTFPHLALVFSSGFMAGILASVHCVLMCGGIAVLAVQKKNGLWPHALRIMVYVLLAVLAGSVLEQWIQFPRWILGVTLIAAGIYSWNKQVRLSGKQSKDCSDSCKKHTCSSESARILWLWGLLPCPMVFMMLASTIALSPLEAGALMLAFGFGTLPGLLSAAYSARWLIERLSLSRPWLQAGLVAVGVWIILLESVPVDILHGEHHQGHSEQLQYQDHFNHY